MAELFEVAAVPEAGAVGLDEDEAHAARSAVRVGPDDHDDEVAHLAVRDEGLLAGDDVFIAVANGFGADALQVAAGAGLGHGDRADGFARRPYAAATSSSAPRCHNAADSRSRHRCGRKSRLRDQQSLNKRALR